MKVITPEVPTGVIKTFGNFGILYQVGDKLDVLPDGDILLNIKLIETGEITSYKLSKILQDPNAE